MLLRISHNPQQKMCFSVQFENYILAPNPFLITGIRQQSWASAEFMFQEYRLKSILWDYAQFLSITTSEAFIPWQIITHIDVLLMFNWLSFHPDVQHMVSHKVLYLSFPLNNHRFTYLDHWLVTESQAKALIRLYKWAGYDFALHIWKDNFSWRGRIYIVFCFCLCSLLWNPFLFNHWYLGHALYIYIYEPRHDKTCLGECASYKDSEQPISVESNKSHHFWLVYCLGSIDADA